MKNRTGMTGKRFGIIEGGRASLTTQRSNKTTKKRGKFGYGTRAVRKESTDKTLEKTQSTNAKLIVHMKKTEFSPNATFQETWLFRTPTISELAEKTSGRLN